MRRSLLPPRIAHACRVALAATLLVGAVYAASAVVLDKIVAARLAAGVDARLTERLADFTTRVPASRAHGDDDDGAPVFLWLGIAHGSAVPLSTNAPALPAGVTLASGQSRTTQVGPSTFRLKAARSGRSVLIAGQSLADQTHFISVLRDGELLGAPALLLEHYSGRLEYHEPWHLQREVSHLFRGLVEALEVDRLLADAGHANLRLVDNGVVNRRSDALAGLPHVRGYHLVPAGASKAAAVAFHRQARGYSRAEAFAVGDSREDLACAAQVAAFWLVANAVAHDPSMRAAMAAHDNVRVTEAGNGPGVYEAVLSTLMSADGA